MKWFFTILGVVVAAATVTVVLLHFLQPHATIREEFVIDQ